MADKMYTQAEYEAMVEERDALKSKAEELLGEVKGVKRRLKDFEGLDPKEIKELIAKSQQDEGDRAKKAGDWEKREAQLSEKHAKEIQAARDEAVAANQAVERYLLDAETVKAIDGKGSAKLLLPVVKPHLKVMKGENGDHGVRVIDAEGNIRVKVEKGKAVPLTVAEFVAELREDPELAGAFAGSGASGSGAGRSEGKTGGMKVIPSGDEKAFLANLDKIAKGEVTVG